MEKITPTIKPSYKQHLAYEKLWDDVTSFILFGGGAEGGKSWLGAEWLLTNCYRYPGTKWFMGRKELKRLKSSSYATFRKICVYHQVPREDWKFNGQDNYIEFVNPDTGTFDGEGSRIDLLDLALQPSDPNFQRFGSTEYTGGWIEEAGEVHFGAFDMLKSRIGRWRNNEYGLNPAKILLTCNPEQNWLYRIFYKPWKKGLLPVNYAFIQALYKDNPYTAEEAGKRLDMITDPTLRSRLKMGLWEYATGDNSLCEYDAIIDLFTNHLPQPKEFEKPLPRYLTIDVARYGGDEIVCGNWKGLEVYRLWGKVNRGIDLTAEDVKLDLKDQFIPYSHAIADDDGVGGGLVDMVKGIKGFVGNSSPIMVKDEYSDPEKKERRENYGNLRSQCGFMLADKINNHQIAITASISEVQKEKIIEDLQQLKKLETPNEAPLRLISKEDIKEALGRSPDYGDMLMMRMYFELKKPDVFIQNNDPGGIKPLINGTLV